MLRKQKLAKEVCIYTNKPTHSSRLNSSTINNSKAVGQLKPNQYNTKYANANQIHTACYNDSLITNNNNNNNYYYYYYYEDLVVISQNTSKNSYEMTSWILTLKIEMKLN